MSRNTHYYEDPGINGEDAFINIKQPGGYAFGPGSVTFGGSGGSGGSGGNVPVKGAPKSPPAGTPPPGGTTPTTPAPGTTTPPPVTPSSFMDWMKDPSNIAGLAALVASLTGNRGQEADPQNTEELRRIRAITEAKMRRVDPLHQAVSALAFSRMPVSARQGITYTNTPLPQEQT